MEEREPLCTVIGNKNCEVFVENSVAFPQKLKKELLYDQATPHFCQQLLFVVLFDNSYFNRYEVISHCGFNMDFPNDL